MPLDTEDMMIKLSVLTDEELAQVDTAVKLIDAAIALLHRRKAFKAREGIDLIELAGALEEEKDSRAIEDAEYRVRQAVAAGELVEVERPDGQKGYAPRG